MGPASKGNGGQRREWKGAGGGERRGGDSNSPHTCLATGLFIIPPHWQLANTYVK